MDCRRGSALRVLRKCPSCAPRGDALHAVSRQDASAMDNQPVRCLIKPSATPTTWFELTLALAPIDQSIHTWAEVQVSAGRRKHKRQRPSSPCLGCTYEEENGGTSQAISPGWGERGRTPAHHGRRGCRLAPESASPAVCPLCPLGATDTCKGGLCEDCCLSNRGEGPFNCCGGGGGEPDSGEDDDCTYSQEELQDATRAYMEDSTNFRSESTPNESWDGLVDAIAERFDEVEPGAHASCCLWGLSSIVWQHLQTIFGIALCVKCLTP